MKPQRHGADVWELETQKDMVMYQRLGLALSLVVFVGGLIYLWFRDWGVR
ncbi:MAG: hypothetical protein HYX27_12670 [Acidobacteria bacterium]|nr:hypothetical protein [Acidobacteriota bacterium]